MHKLTTALLAALFGAASFAGTAYSQALHPERAHTGLLASGPAVALADDDDDNGQGDRGEHGRGNARGCINPAGHERGWCKRGNRNGRGNYGNTYGNNYSTISGTVMAVNGDLVQFRQDNGATMTLNQRNLRGNGGGLNVGGHYTLRGYWNNNMFVAQSNGGYYGGNSPNNGYPYPGNGSGNANASVQGVITAVNGNRVTIMQGLFQSVTIDDQQALNNGSAQNLYVGRSITAYGFWSGNTFYATSIG